MKLINSGDVSQLFRDLSHQKELDSSFDYLTDEQRKFLISFWGSFESNVAENKDKFLQVWHRLHLLYETFKKNLLTNGVGYEGMLQRNVAEQLEENLKKLPDNAQIVFAGFNALTKAEEVLISTHVSQGKAEVYWDIDSYYVNNSAQEAGKFFRIYQNHSVLGKTFPKDIQSNFIASSIGNDILSDRSLSSGNKSIRVFGAAHPVSQTKIMSQVLQEEMEKGIDPEETFIALPDENLLLPVLHSISGILKS